MSIVSWAENGTQRTASWHSENGSAPPTRIVVIDDRTTANEANRLAGRGVGLLWRGDFHNGRQLLRALDRRLQKRSRSVPHEADLAARFHTDRATRATRADLLGKVLMVLEPDHTLQLRRAPDVRDACDHAYGSTATESAPHSTPTVISLPELLGVISAYQWHQEGIEIEQLQARIHPAYGVFAPTRGEYIDLVHQAPLPAGVDRPVVFDIGTGTGVLAAVLAQRGARQVWATDINPRAVRCAQENVQRLGLAEVVRVGEADVWPSEPERADVIICNPPWIPSRPTSALELGIYDEESAFLQRFLRELPHHLTPRGEGWLILSDLAEHLGLRTRDALLTLVADAGLQVTARQDTSPRHPRAADDTDPLHAARAQERTSLWRLARSDAGAAVAAGDMA